MAVEVNDEIGEAVIDTSGAAVFLERLGVIIGEMEGVTACGVGI